MRRFLSWLLLDRHAGSRALIVGGGIAAVQCGLLLGAATLDNNLQLPGPSIGLLEHPGIAAVIAADFVVLAMLGFATRQFVRFPGRLPVLTGRTNRRFLRRCASRGKAAILLRGRALTFFLFFVGAGTLFWLLNAVQTSDPVKFYGRDVFDSSNYPVSYVLFRLILWFSWAALYPYAMVVFLGITGNLYLATRTLSRRGQLTYRLFHPDRCGGFSIVGDISFATIMSVTMLYASLATVVFTHHKLNVLQVSGFVILSIILLIFTYLIAWPVTRFMWRRRRAAQNSSYRSASHSRDPFPAIQMVWLTSATSYSPYAAYQRVLINGARMLPFMVAALRLSAAISG